jgi:DNA modification methylase
MNSSDVELIQADARRLPLPDESVQCIVTSPPYWGLRKYAGEQESVWLAPNGGEGGGTIGHFHLWTASRHGGISGGQNQGDKSDNSHGATNRPVPAYESNTCECGAWRGAYGLEPTIEMYVAHTVEILRELRRVLRPDGVLFWNIGDSYAGSWGAQGRNGEGAARAKGSYARQVMVAVQKRSHTGSISDPFLKPKDLCLVPARVAIAAQADGWWIRSMIVWAKPNPMPESCTDRPTDAYEHILMLTKSEWYFWDADAVRELGSPDTHSRGNNNFGGPKAQQRANEGVHVGWAESTREVLGYRNIRNVWTFPTQPFSGAHFATFPEEIPRRCILAATSARGACTQCGAPWERVIRRNAYRDGSWFEGIPEDAPRPKMGTGTEFYEGYDPPKTIGWRPTCECRGQHGKTRPCLVLDPFAGSGTTGRVARALRRHAVLADVAYGEQDEYRKLALARLRNVDVELPFLD